jgi:isopentenyl-diphosphate delta-isomerase
MTKIETRKQRHISVSLNNNVQSDVGTGLSDVRLIHRAIPEVNLSEISTETTLFSKRLKAPLIISALTGGTAEARRINSTLADVAEVFGIGLGVGSQRIAVEQEEKEGSFRVVRERALDTLVFGNMGCPQLSLGWGVAEAKRCVEMIAADALAIHMNPLQEAIQLEGETNYRGILDKVKEITRSLDVPVVMKETGCGVAHEDAVRLEEAGVAGIDVSGLGGTSWAAIEHFIAKESGKVEQETLGKALWNWGIPTAVSVVEVRRSTGLKVVASGGIRTGTDMAKAIALGADAVGIAKPFLDKAVEGSEALRKHIEGILREFRVIMFLVGARDIEELKRVPLVILGDTAEWLRSRGFKTEEYARRR